VVGRGARVRERLGVVAVGPGVCALRRVVVAPAIAVLVLHAGLGIVVGRGARERERLGVVAVGARVHPRGHLGVAPAVVVVVVHARLGVLELGRPGERVLVAVVAVAVVVDRARRLLVGRHAHVGIAEAVAVRVHAPP